MPELSDILSFLQSNVSIPVWLLLLLLLIMLVQLINIYKKKGIIRVEKSKNLTDNKFTRSIITTVEKLTNVSENPLTNSIITTAKKIRKDLSAKKSEVVSNKAVKENILKLLYSAGGDGRLRESIAEELKLDKNSILQLLDELITAKLVESRNTAFGQTYHLTKVGKEYHARKIQPT